MRQLGNMPPTVRKQSGVFDRNQGLSLASCVTGSRKEARVILLWEENKLYFLQLSWFHSQTQLSIKKGFYSQENSPQRNDVKLNGI